MGFNILQIAIVLAILLLLVKPVGTYMAVVFMRKKSPLDRVFDPVDNTIYRLSGINPDVQQRWPAYVKAMLLTNAVMFALFFVIYELQAVLPLNPDGQAPVPPWLALNTAMSFITNTNWQNYGGENTLSYFSQLTAIIFPQFTSAATGLACGVAFIRGLAGSTSLGNFYVDLTRAITRIMLPIAFVAAIVFVALGVPATFDGSLTVNTLNGPLTPPAATAATSDRPVHAARSLTSQGQQTITRGPVAALTSIKHLGTNGGGWFNANSTHPFENPNPISNVLENVLMAMLPMGLIYTLGIMTNRMKQAATFFWVMAGFFVVFLVIAYAGEVQGNPLLTSLGLNPAQGNLEGHEFRFGQGLTALFVTSTTAFHHGHHRCHARQPHPAGQHHADLADAAEHGLWRQGRRLHQPGHLRHSGGVPDGPDGRPHTRVPGQEDRGVRSQAGRSRVPDAPDADPVLHGSDVRLLTGPECD